MLYVIYCLDIEGERNNRKEFILEEDSVKSNEKLLKLLDLLMDELCYARIMKATVDSIEEDQFGQLGEFCKKEYFTNIRILNKLLKDNYQIEYTKDVTDEIEWRNKMNEIIRKMKVILKFSLAKDDYTDAMYIRVPGSYGTGRR